MSRSQKTTIAPGWQTWLRRAGLDTVAGVYANPTGNVITQSRTSEVRRIALMADGKPRVLFLKKYWFNSWQDLWKGMLRGALLGRAKARREFASLQLLHQLGIGAANPVACGEERQAGWLRRSFLITEGVPDPMPLDEFIRDALPALPAAEQRRQRRQLITVLADFTARMHAARFVHHDFFWRNLILSGASREEFFLIDAPKGQLWQPGAALRSRAKDLATLDAPAPRFFRRTERLRFFLRYAGHPRLTATDKKLIRRALRVAGAERERQLRRVGEPRPPEQAR
jgi:tRNA A-37 threonylcarbamoyl transferase component Bud32